MLAGFATLLTYHHTEPAGALGPREDEARVFPGALEMCPSSTEMEKGQHGLSSSFPHCLCAGRGREKVTGEGAAQPHLGAEPCEGSERRAVGSDLHTQPTAPYCRPGILTCPLWPPNAL